MQGSNTLVFSLIVPSGTKPAKGWPVAIMGHYSNGSKEDIYLFASRLANRGMATIAINGPGHGANALGTADFNLTSGETVTISAGGRGVDADLNDKSGANEGFITVGAPYALIGYRDVIRQTVANLMQLVRVIQTGMDVDSDGTADLDPARLTFLGSSLGGNYGIPFQAVEGAIRASTVLQARITSLLNLPGVTRIARLAMAAPYFKQNKPLRNLPPVINDVARAAEIQRVLDHQSWSAQSADPVAYAP